MIYVEVLEVEDVHECPLAPRIQEQMIWNNNVLCSSQSSECFFQLGDGGESSPASGTMESPTHLVQPSLIATTATDECSPDAQLWRPSSSSTNKLVTSGVRYKPFNDDDAWSHEDDEISSQVIYIIFSYTVWNRWIS